MTLPKSSDPNELRSRYRTTECATFEAGGQTLRWRLPRILPQLDELPKVGRLTSVRPGERLDQLAARLLGDPAAHYQLTDSNSSLDPLEFVDDLGSSIVMPPRWVPR